MSDDSPSSYDEIPYTSFPYSRTHPDRLCTLGRLFGLAAADPKRCRVLELGCAAGGNLVPMAEALPDSRFVGVDLSERQIAEGNEFVGALGLQNIELRCASILDVDASYGEFDYVVCHGVYSWVPPQVQQKILEICRDRLAPTGIGYISYNTYPGWHLRDSVRHMMRWHVAGFAEPRRRIEQARALVDFLARAVEHQSSPHALLLKRELAILSRTGDDYVYHEHLEDQNQPIYFHEFAERLEHHGLQFLCESDVHTMLPRELSAEVGETLQRVSPDLLRMEQYLDFVRNRQFRASLICPVDAKLRRSLGPESIMSFRIGFAGKGDGTPVDLSPGVAHRFETADGLEVASSEPITKAALLWLRRHWPGDVAFSELCERTVSILRESGIEVPDDPDPRVRLAADLLECLVGGGGVELRVHAPDLVAAVPDHPRTSASTRWQSRRHGFATNGRHQRVDLDTIAGQVARLADGTRDRAALLDDLVAAAARGEFAVTRDDAPVKEAAELRDPLGPVLDRTLGMLAGYGVLTASRR
jgi:SAM-dependent methyltransferase